MENSIKRLKKWNYLQTAKNMLSSNDDWFTGYYGNDYKKQLKADIQLKWFMLNYDDMIQNSIRQQGALDIRGE